MLNRTGSCHTPEHGRTPDDTTFCVPLFPDGSLTVHDALEDGRTHNQYMVLRNAPHRMRRMSIDGQDRSQQDFKVQNQHNEPRETGDLLRRESILGILNRIKTRPESLHAYHRKFPVRRYRIPHSEVHTHGFSSSAQRTSHLTSRILWGSLNCNPSKSTNQGIGLLEQNAHRFTMRSTHIRHRCKISTSREFSLHGMYGRPRRQYPTHDKFDCVVTPNVRQRLVERNVLCIVVDVRLRTRMRI